MGFQDLDIPCPKALGFVSGIRFMHGLELTWALGSMEGLGSIWGFPKIRGTILGVPITRTIVFWGLHWGPLILGNYMYHIGLGGF